MQLPGRIGDSGIIRSSADRTVRKKKAYSRAFPYTPCPETRHSTATHSVFHHHLQYAPFSTNLVGLLDDGCIIIPFSHFVNRFSGIFGAFVGFTAQRAGGRIFFSYSLFKSMIFARFTVRKQKKRSFLRCSAESFSFMKSEVRSYRRTRGNHCSGRSFQCA